ncbi:hypothetical protein Q1695_006834 [Nippostrongylus brasiliensis]|nr:hypothetical protein Q1695_006834 [Nippostrongylus brasiliensis]
MPSYSSYSQYSPSYSSYSPSYASQRSYSPYAPRTIWYPEALNYVNQRWREYNNAQGQSYQGNSNTYGYDAGRGYPVRKVHEGQTYRPSEPSYDSNYRPAQPTEERIYRPAPPTEEIYRPSQPSEGRTYKPSHSSEESIYRPSGERTYKPAPPVDEYDSRSPPPLPAPPPPPPSSSSYQEQPDTGYGSDGVSSERRYSQKTSKVEPLGPVPPSGPPSDIRPPSPPTSDTRPPGITPFWFVGRTRLYRSSEEDEPLTKNKRIDD